MYFCHCCCYNVFVIVILGKDWGEIKGSETGVKIGNQNKGIPKIVNKNCKSYHYLLTINLTIVHFFDPVGIYWSIHEIDEWLSVNQCCVRLCSEKFWPEFSSNTLRFVTLDNFHTSQVRLTVKFPKFCTVAPEHYMYLDLVTEVRLLENCYYYMTKILHTL